MEVIQTYNNVLPEAMKEQIVTAVNSWHGISNAQFVEDFTHPVVATEIALTLGMFYGKKNVKLVLIADVTMNKHSTGWEGLGYYFEGIKLGFNMHPSMPTWYYKLEYSVIVPNKRNPTQFTVKKKEEYFELSKGQKSYELFKIVGNKAREYGNIFYEQRKLANASSGPESVINYNDYKSTIHENKHELEI